MNRRAQIALTPEEQRQYLEESHTIILVSNDRRGYPHPVAMWFLAEPDGAVAMTTFRKSQKALNLRRDPRCSLLLESGRTYPELKGIILRGRADEAASEVRAPCAGGEQLLALVLAIAGNSLPGENNKP